LTLEHSPGYLATVDGPEQADEIFRCGAHPGADWRPGSRSLSRTHVATSPPPLRQALVPCGAVCRDRRGDRAVRRDNVICLSAAGAANHQDRLSWLGQRWWRSGANTEAKLLIMTFAVEVLGAVRVVWVTGILNLRARAPSSGCAAVTNHGSARDSSPVPSATIAVQPAQTGRRPSEGAR
jgi:N-acetyltransferase